MKCLIVISHPLKNSLCKLLGRYVENKLSQIGHEVTVEDLYAENFSPALTERERRTYYEDVYDSSNIAERVNRLREAEAIVLLFPTWWFGFPAMLKGWFDRVWGPGIAYDHADDFGPIKPRLERLKRVMVVTTLGSPWWVDRVVMRQPVKRITKRALLGACSKKSKLQFLTLYDSEKLDGHEVEKFKTKIGKAIDVWTK